MVLAHEVLDAMPFERIRIEPDGAMQGYVKFDDDKQAFDWDYQPITEKPLTSFTNHLIKYLGEVSD